MKTESWTLPKGGVRSSSAGQCSQATLTHHIGGEPGLEHRLEIQPQVEGEVEVTQRGLPQTGQLLNQSQADI